MPAAAARRRTSKDAEGRDKRRASAAPAARTGQSLEQRILLTATLCLLAFGAVMVYSASSARGVLQGQGSSGYLVRFLIYGGLGLLAMHWLARTPSLRSPRRSQNSVTRLAKRPHGAGSTFAPASAA